VCVCVCVCVCVWYGLMDPMHEHIMCVCERDVCVRERYGSMNPIRYPIVCVCVRERETYGVATISRLLKIIGLFCRISSIL